MFRKDLIELLRDRFMTVQDIARQEALAPKEVEEDLRHVAQSLRHTELALSVEPARCRKCGFEFGDDKWRKPSKCPKCRGTWITAPRVAITRKTPG